MELELLLQEGGNWKVQRILPQDGEESPACELTALAEWIARLLLGE